MDNIVPPIDDDKFFLMEQENVELKRKLQGFESDDILKYARENPALVSYYKDFDNHITLNPEKKQAILDVLNGKKPEGFDENGQPNSQDPMLKNLQSKVASMEEARAKEQRNGVMQQQKEAWNTTYNAVAERKGYEWMKSKVAQSAILMHYATHPGCTQAEAIRTIGEDLRKNSATVNLTSIENKLKAPVIQGKGGGTTLETLPEAPDEINSKAMRDHLKQVALRTA